MRRKDKKIESIIRRAKVCHLALIDGNCPYIISMCFGYHNYSLYFHCASEGKKTDILKNNRQVCFEFDVDVDIVPSEAACNWSMKYSSVIGFGTASFVSSPESKQTALDIICRKYTGDRPFAYTDESLARLTIIRVDIESMTGKRSP